DILSLAGKNIRRSYRRCGCTRWWSPWWRRSWWRSRRRWWSRTRQGSRRSRWRSSQRPSIRRRRSSQRSCSRAQSGEGRRKGRSPAIELARRLTDRQEILAATELDSELIGGVVLDIGGTVYDGSLKTQLARLT